MFGLIALLAARITSPRVITEDDIDSCQLCKAICIGVEELHADGRSVEQIEDYVMKECEILPDYSADLCKNLADAYVPAVVQWIDQGFDEQKICVRLGYCK